MKSERMCKICTVAAWDRVFQPCGHLLCCSSCTKKLAECPICRTPIRGLVVVVIPEREKGRWVQCRSLDCETLLKSQRYFGIKESERHGGLS